MEQSNITPNTEFLKRRNQKNWIVMALIFGFVAIVWGVTMLKFDPVSFRNLARPAPTETTKEEPQQQAPEEAKHAQ